MKNALLLLLSLLAGCAGQPTPTQPAAPLPSQLSASADPSVKGRRLTWGGEVISVKNLEDRTLVEIMAHPLLRNGEPQVGGANQGRFIADYPGFLDPADYPPGQRVTVTGPMLGYLDGKVGQASYRYPVLAAEKIERWEARQESSWRRPAINVGVGIGGGSHSSWGNIGIGFGF